MIHCDRLYSITCSSTSALASRSSNSLLPRPQSDSPGKHFALVSPSFRNCSVLSRNYQNHFALSPKIDEVSLIKSNFNLNSHIQFSGSILKGSTDEHRLDRLYDRLPESLSGLAFPCLDHGSTLPREGTTLSSDMNQSQIHF